MLKTLRISDYALIDNLMIEFKPGLNIFTGSTGVGKSIIFGALSLAMGERTSDEVIRTGAKSATVEAEFSYDKINKLPFEMAGDSESLIIRREINNQGRSRAYINNRLATLVNLKAIGSNLIDIIGQHRQKGLTDSASHQDILDLYAGLKNELEQLRKLFNKHNKLKSEYEKLKIKQKESEDEKELLEFQIKEIEQASLIKNEEEQLKKEKQQLLNAEAIKLSCQISGRSLFDEDGSAFERFKNSAKELGRIAKFSNRAEVIRNKLDELSINLDEIGIQLRGLGDSYEFDEAKLDIIEDRLALINKLKRKYGNTIEEILRFADDAVNKAAVFSNDNQEIKKLADELKTSQQQLFYKAAEISQKRKQAAQKLEKEVVKHLTDMAMKDAAFKVDFSVKNDVDGPYIDGSTKLAGSESGYDNIELLICANPGEQLKPLSTTASGGELSRILLAICSALVDAFPKETLVFDEIDTGISGEVAVKVGRKLQKLAENRQVICITHLQQLASRGEEHFKVYKGRSKGRYVTRIKKLEGDQRIAEIARLLAGEKISDIALDGAAKLLEEGRG